MSHRRPLRLGLSAALAFALTAAAAPAAEVTLTLHHFLGPKSPTHLTLIAPWAERIEAQSGGRIDVEIFPAMAMGGKPAELYRQVRDGVADIVWTLPGYTPGVFPRVEAFELPTVHRGGALATNLAIQDVWPLVAPDFAAIKPILVHAHAGNALFLRAGAPKGPADLAGLRLRTPSRTGAAVIAGWGAEPVGMPVPELTQALAKGAVDGALLPFEIAPSLKMHEVARVAVEGADGGRFGGSVFLFAMNRDRYEALPDDLKAVIDANSGPALAAEMGAAWDANEQAGRDGMRAGGGDLVLLDAPTMAAFDALGAAVVEDWIAEARGFDARALVDAARTAVAARAAP